MPKTTVRPIGSGLSGGDGMLVVRDAGVAVGIVVFDIKVATGVVVIVMNIVEEGSGVGRKRRRLAYTVHRLSSGDFSDQLGAEVFGEHPMAGSKPS
jgi:hypothetical protein